MSEMTTPVDGMPAPEACTLLTAERPLRLAEFDDLFATTVLAVDYAGPLRLRLELQPDPAAAARAADLVVRETQCCSFFTFTLAATGGQLSLEIAVPAAYRGVLDAMAARAADASGGAAG